MISLNYYCFFFLVRFLRYYHLVLRRQRSASLFIVELKFFRMIAALIWLNNMHVNVSGRFVCPGYSIRMLFDYVRRQRWQIATRRRLESDSSEWFWENVADSRRWQQMRWSVLITHCQQTIAQAENINVRPIPPRLSGTRNFRCHFHWIHLNHWLYEERIEVPFIKFYYSSEIVFRIHMSAFIWLRLKSECSASTRASEHRKIHK